MAVLLHDRGIGRQCRATGAMTGTFIWTCDHGKLTGDLILAPTTTTGIQALRLDVVKPD